MSNVRARFFKDDDRNMVEIKIVGDPNDLIQRVTPEHINRYPEAWAAFQAGQDNIDYGGTPLTDVPGIDRNLAMSMKLKNVHNAEMLADLSDAAANSLGIGGQTFRRAAQLLIKANKADALEATVKAGRVKAA